MTAGKCGTTRCGLCRFYSHEGRRGGLCHQLNVNVDSHWKACCLAESPFMNGIDRPDAVAGIAKLVAAPTREVSVVPKAKASTREVVNAPAAIVEPFQRKVAKPLDTRIAFSTLTS